MPAPEAPISYNETGKWRENLDLKAWGNEVRQVQQEVLAESADMSGEKDMNHMLKIRTWANVSYAAGIVLSGIIGLPNPIAALLVSTGVVARWTMIGHHVCHGGYNAYQTDDQGKVSGKFHRRRFARGPFNRVFDWLDWMLPEAWDVEHNHLHHWQLGEEADPDLVERNLAPTLDKYPMALRYAAMVGVMFTWKWFYYMPNTLKELSARKVERNQLAKGEKPVDFKVGTRPATTLTLLREATKGNFGPLLTTTKCAMPYFSAHFLAIPAAFYLALGPVAAANSLATMVVAELLTNLHSFIIIATNHAGHDVYRFETTVKPKSDEFLLRAVIGSVNFPTGNDANDFVHGWLNYQIEHHMFPDMSMLQYQKMAPEIKAICEKHGVPYVQQNVFKRVVDTVDVGIGRKTMRVWENGD